MLRLFERVGRRGQRRYERSDSLDAKGRHAPDPASVPSVAIWHAPPPPPPSPRPALTSGTSFLIYTLLILTGPNGGYPLLYLGCQALFEEPERFNRGAEITAILLAKSR